MLTKARLKQLAAEHGTPLFIVDHDQLRRNYATFRKHLPRVQIYYAVKANSDPAIVRTLYQEGASFDVASMPEFLNVYQNITHLPQKERLAWIWDKIIYANPIKAIEALKELDQYKPSSTRSRSTRPTPASCCASRCRTPARWSNCRASSGLPRAKPST